MNNFTMTHSEAAGLVAADGNFAGSAEAPQMPIVRRYLLIAFRQKYILGGAILACLLIGLIATFLMTPKFTAISTIEIARESNKITDIQGVEREANAADQEFYQTQYGLLRSRSLAERVATQLRLVDDPSFFERFNTSEQGNAFTRINNRYTAAGRADRRKIAGEILLDNLDVAPIRLSRLVEIRFTSPDAAFSAKVANAWSANFVEATLERRYQATSYARDFLESRLGQLRKRLEDSERQLVGYAAAQQIINLPTAGEAGGPPAERSIVADNLAALNASLAQATADRIQAQARYEQAGGAGSTTEALRNDAINNLRQRRAELQAEYQRLMVQFEPEYPAARSLKSQIEQLDRSIGREEQRVVSSINADYREALEREQSLEARVNGLKSEFLDARGRSIQYNIFQREVDTNRELYNGLLQRYKEIGVAGGVGVNNIAVVDPAELPRRPSSPRLLINLGASILAGLLIGVALALALEQMDEAIADPTEVERQLGLPLLGSIPKLRDGKPIDALSDRKSELVDAYLAVQTNLQFTTAHGIPRSLAITSTRPAEGKSTTALSLAVMLARSHQKVVLIDGDMRSPSIHHLIGIDHDMGLSNYLSGADEIEPLLNLDENLGLTVITSGPIPPNAAELLTGNRLAALIERLHEKFDHIVIDSPPVMGLADAPLIASRVEGLIYTVESHGIRTSLVRTALARLRAANVHIIGSVLTKFEARKAHVGYGYEYGYSYGRSKER